MKVSSLRDLAGTILVVAIGLTWGVAPARARHAPHGPLTRAQIHRVVAGETLWSIARQDLGTSKAWKALYDLNMRVIGPDPRSVRAGTLLVLPSGSSGHQGIRVAKNPPPERRPRSPRESPPRPKPATASRNPFHFTGQAAPYRPTPVSTPGRDPFTFEP